MKDYHQDKPSPELIKLIAYGHKKELQITNEVFDAISETGLKGLINVLAESSDATLAHVLNTLVRQTKLRKAELENNKK